MRTQADYLDRAKEWNQIGSDSQLAKLMKVHKNTISAARHDHFIFTEEHIRDLAKLCGWDQQVALIERAFWKAKDDDTRAMLKDILKRISALLPGTVFSLYALAPSAAEAAQQAANAAPHLPSGLAAAVVGVCILRETKLCQIMQNIVYYGNQDTGSMLFVIIIIPRACISSAAIQH